jgi:uncharacterized protein (DUF1015 family)
MAYIAPFRALRYDPTRVELRDVVTQPYDKITSEMQDRYYAASPHNLVRIILGKKEADDRPGNDAYSRAAQSFLDWRREGTFLQDPQPSIYTYVQQFQGPYGGTELERRGFIALGRIEDYSAGVVFRHEQTLAKPKADRLELLRATRAHFGQIFMLYDDPASEVETLLRTHHAHSERLRDEFGVLHQFSRISDPGLIELIRGKMRDKKLIIADGHHRYETALNYRNELRQSGEIGSNAEPAPHEMVMMTFVNIDSPGLLVLPTHRVVHGLDGISSNMLREKSAQYFSVEDVDAAIDAQRATRLLRDIGATGTAILAVSADRAMILNKPKAMGSKLFDGFSPQQQSLDVVQLHRCLLEGALGISEEALRQQTNVAYLRDASEALAMVRSGRANVAFLMNPVRMRQIRDIAFAGEVLPQKSTDFYPKLLSGLAIYALE